MCDRLSVHGRGKDCALPRLLGWDDGNTYGNRYASMQLFRLVYKEAGVPDTCPHFPCRMSTLQLLNPWKPYLSAGTKYQEISCQIRIVDRNIFKMGDELVSARAEAGTCRPNRVERPLTSVRRAGCDCRV